MRGIERRIEAGLDPGVRLGRLALHQPLGRRRRRRGARRAAQPARDRGRRSAPTAPTASCSTPSACSGSLNEGARPQRLLWASTGTKDPDASDILYIEALRRAVHDQHDAGARPCSPSPTTARSATRCRADGGDAEEVLARVRRGRDRRRRARRAAPGGGRGGLRQVLERAARRSIESKRTPAGARDGACERAPRDDAAARAPAWKALERHYAEIGDAPPARPLRRRPRARRAPGRRGRRPLPRLLEEPDHRRDAAAARRAGATSAASPSAATRCSPASTSTSPRTAPCCTWRCGCRASARSIVDGVDVVKEVHEVLDRMARLRRAGPLAASGRATPASRSATSSTSASAAPTSAR